jgi:hypothetical protein
MGAMHRLCPVRCCLHRHAVGYVRVHIFPFGCWRRFASVRNRDTGRHSDANPRSDAVTNSQTGHASSGGRRAGASSRCREHVRRPD